MHADFLTAAEHESLRLELVVLEKQLGREVELGAETAKPVELDPTTIGRLSRTDAMQQQAMAKATQQKLNLRLQLVRNALKAVDTGDYGRCRKCEEPIGHQRLSVRPESPFCLDCQHTADRR